MYAKSGTVRSDFSALRGVVSVVKCRVAVEDSSLAAVVIAQTPLHYSDAADAALDRPAHLRSASSLAMVPGGIALIQDDANFVALIAPDLARVLSIPLPAGVSGARQFDDRRGNKASKLDLEACVSVPGENGIMLIAMGSGANAQRENIVLIDGWELAQPDVTLVNASRFYEGLRSAESFAGSQLNIEGAIMLDDCVRLFGRGNGVQRDGFRPVNATCDVELRALMDYLRAPERTAPPTPAHIVRYELGAFAGVPLSFTDAAVCGEAVLFTAAAEDSPDAIQDGNVFGSAIGTIDATGHARWATLTDESGVPFPGKVEGLVVNQSCDSLLVVADPDNPDVASVLCTVELRGDW